jgi:hypothetical protein
MEGQVNSVEKYDPPKYEPPTLRIIGSEAEFTQAQREKRLGRSATFIFRALAPSARPSERSPVHPGR